MKKLLLAICLLTALLALFLCSCDFISVSQSDCSHVWEDPVTTKTPTCTTMGQQTQTCKKCGKTNTTVLMLAQHTWGAGTTVSKADGLYTRYTCTACNEVKDEYLATLDHVHTWDSGMVTTTPTCTTTGVKTFTCTECQGTKTETVPVSATAHTLGTGTVKTASTCAVAGTMQYTCTRCLAKVEEKLPLDSTSHRKNAGTTVKAPTCQAAGSIRYTCPDCQTSWTESVAASADYHVLTGGTVKTAPTCSTGGKTEYTCSVCKTKVTKDTAPDASLHVWVEGTKVSSGTCSTLAQYNYTCSACHTTKTEGKAGTLAPSNHTYNAGTVKTAATCGTAGVREKTCTGCGNKIQEAIPATGSHSWGSSYATVASATCGAGAKREYTCTKCGETKIETTSPTGTHTYSTESFVLTEPTSSSVGTLYVYCTNCGTRKQSGTITYADYTSQINSLKTAINAFSLSTFGGSYSTMSTTAYNAPTAYPTARVAATSQYPSTPRVLMSASDIATLRAAFADPATGDTLNDIVVCANSYTSGTLGATTTYSSSSGVGPRGTHNCNEEMLRAAICQALLYQMTGSELYGYRAIKIIKEYISTIKITSVNDSCRTYGFTMFTAAIVYDWCRDLLTANDKQQIIAGVQHKLCEGGKMEVGFPPSGQGAVSGHGAERQILRDYLAFAIAIYDDEPTWYKYIAGRVYQEYVPVRNVYYSSGFTPQGVSNYVSIRFASDLWSAWLLKSATGTNPYNEEDMSQVMHSIYAYFVNCTTFMFEEGDEEQNSAKQKTLNFALCGMMSAYLFNDPYVEVWARNAEYKYIDSAYFFILKTGFTADPVGARYDGMDLITYNGGFESRIIAHNKWTKYDAAVFMKIGSRMTANHDHADAGSFQIYYRGLLAGDSGVYDSYGSSQHKYYHQATVAHNSILIYNGSTGYGQLQPGESGTYANWSTNSKYATGDTKGVSYAYDENGTPLYAYIAGELSGCYETSAGASRVERRMLTVYDTENANAPMYMFVSDVVKTSSSTYRKAFLLHTATQPTISGNTVTVVNGDGKLVLQNLTNNTITTAGQYEVSGSTTTAATTKDDGMWGRVEISATGQQESFMLNVMYVTDATKTLNLTATKISSSTYTGAQMGQVVAIFMDSADRVSSKIVFTSSGSGNINYYVSGVAAGTWTVSVGGQTLTATATEEGGLLSFTAPAGTVTLTKN